MRPYYAINIKIQQVKTHYKHAVIGSVNIMHLMMSSYATRHRLRVQNMKKHQSKKKRQLFIIQVEI